MGRGATGSSRGGLRRKGAFARGPGRGLPCGKARFKMCIRDSYKDKRVVVFDRGSVISFLGCGMALWIGGQISGPDGLFYASKEAFEQKGATVHMETEVTDIDFAAKRVTARTKDGSTITQGLSLIHI